MQLMQCCCWCTVAADALLLLMRCCCWCGARQVYPDVSPLCNCRAKASVSPTAAFVPSSSQSAAPLLHLPPKPSGKSLERKSGSHRHLHLTKKPIQETLFCLRSHLHEKCLFFFLLNLFLSVRERFCCTLASATFTRFFVGGEPILAMPGFWEVVECPPLPKVLFNYPEVPWDPIHL